MDVEEFQSIKRQVREMAMGALKGRGLRELTIEKLKERGSLVRNLKFKFE